MWHTSKGDRILHGAEARLFKAALTGLVEYTTEPDEWSCGIVLFDELTFSQRLAVLEGIATALLTEAQVMPELTAVNEAAIAAVFEYASFEIDLEIDLNPSTTVWRQMVYDANEECFADDLECDPEYAPDDDYGCPLSVESGQRKGWHSAIEALADRILWDRDFEMVSDFLDEPPDKAALLRQIMGIDDDYFAVAADDLVTPEQANKAIHRLTKILK